MTNEFLYPDRDSSLELISDQNEIHQYVRDVSHASHPELERRKSSRYSMVTEITVQPIDDDLQPLGECFQSNCCNISNGGLGFIHHEPIPSGHLILELPKLQVSDRLYTVAKVTYRMPIANDLYHIGCEFII